MTHVNMNEFAAVREIEKPVRESGLERELYSERRRERDSKREKEK